MSYTESDQYWVNGALRFRTALMQIPASGVLVVDVNSSSAITLIAGGATELLGIEYIDSADGDAPVVLDADQADVKFIRVAPGFAVTVQHNRAVDLAANPIDAANRILTSSGNDFTASVINSQSFFAYVPSLAGFRWYFVDRDAFAATAVGNWSPVPLNHDDALNQLGERAPLVLSGSIAFTSGNAVDLWSYTLAEGEAVGIRFQLTGATKTANVIDRSLGRIAVVGSRDIGGAAAATVGAGDDEVGVLAGGTMSAAAVGNDVVFRVVYTTNGTLYYKLRIEQDVVVPV